MVPVSMLIIGAGGRGGGYASFAADNPDLARVVGVAEPRDQWRDGIVSKHDVSRENVFTDWRDAAARDRLADAALICTQDAMHAEPAVAFAAKGYHILLEKPMAPNAADCRRIVAAVKASGALFAVCHVMRYTPYSRRVKEIIDSGAIGEVVSIQHLEPVGYWHQAHSFVRGNWRNEAESSPMLLSKSCHDLDWLRYLMGRRCTRVSSFGSLHHFLAEHRPPRAADRCLDCSVEAACPYSAKRFYLGKIQREELGWPVDVLTRDLTVGGVTAALRTGPYGRCVYACDNDVVDHQVVNMEFEGGPTASFTMTAFTPMVGRKTRICGTRGYVEGNWDELEVFDFLTEQTRQVPIEAGGGHGGGDEGIMGAFVRAIAENDPSHILSGPDETLETHLMVFAAEQARREGRVVDVCLD